MPIAKTTGGFLAPALLLANEQIVMLCDVAVLSVVCCNMPHTHPPEFPLEQELYRPTVLGHLLLARQSLII